MVFCIDRVSKGLGNAQHVTKFDHWFPRLAELLRKYPDSRARHILNDIVLMLSDQQLITGASILIAGFSRHCMITQYHFRVVYLLGQTSFLTHQSTIRVMRDKLVHQSFRKLWRFAWITAIFAFVIAFQVIVLSKGFLVIYGLPAQCAWSSPLGYTLGNEIYLAFDLVLSAWGFLAIAYDLFPQHLAYLNNASSFLKAVLVLPGYVLYRATERRWEASISRSARFLWNAARVWAFTVFLVSFTISELFESELVGLLRILMGLVFSTTALFRIRHKSLHNGMESNRDTWGFGQILPNLLLALPLYLVAEILYGSVVTIC